MESEWVEAPNKINEYSKLTFKKNGEVVIGYPPTFPHKDNRPKGKYKYFKNHLFIILPNDSLEKEEGIKTTVQNGVLRIYYIDGTDKYVRPKEED